MKQFTREEVLELSGVGRKVIIINNNVYDVESYLDEHPGGAEIIIDAVGTDATDEFNDIGHSSDALEQLKQFKIGSCNNLVESPVELDTDVIESTDFGARTIFCYQFFLGAIIGLFALIYKLMF